MNKLTLISIFIFTFLTLTLNAQRYGIQNLQEYDYEPCHFGFLLGINNNGFSVKQDYNYLDDPNFPDRTSKSFSEKEVMGGTASTPAYILKSISPSSIPGITIGIVSSFRISDNLNFRVIPSLVVTGGQNLKYTYSHLSGRDTITNQKFSSIFFELPLILRYSGDRIQNARPFIQAGIKYRYNMHSKSEFSIENNTSIPPSPPTLSLNKSDIQGVFGFGCDFYVGWFKMGVEATYSYGFLNGLNKGITIYNSSLKSLNSKGFQISVTFE
jgi:hypothetical protein